jgi:hypothetical protein
MYVLLFTLSLSAENTQNDQTALVSAKTQTLLDKMSKALNLDAFSKVSSIRQSSSMQMPKSGVNINMELSSKGEKVLMKVDIKMQSQTMTQKMGFDGQKAWSQDMMTGLRELTGKERETILKTSLKYLVYPEKYYDEIILHDDKADFQGVSCFKLEYKKQGLKSRFVYVNPETYMSAGEVNVEDGPTGEQTSTTTFTSYKKHIKGFLYADTYKIKVGPMLMNASGTNMEVDILLEDTIFTMPNE